MLYVQGGGRLNKASIKLSFNTAAATASIIINNSTNNNDDDNYRRCLKQLSSRNESF
jgi:hypothetical protein